MPEESHFPGGLVQNNVLGATLERAKNDDPYSLPWTPDGDEQSEGTQVLEKAGCGDKGSFFPMGWSFTLEQSLWVNNFNDLMI